MPDLGRDKLTHAGTYGTPTILHYWNLLDVEVNYYAKVNFTGLIKMYYIRAALQLKMKKSFTSAFGYYYPSGTINCMEKRPFIMLEKDMRFADEDLLVVEIK